MQFFPSYIGGIINLERKTNKNKDIKSTLEISDMKTLLKKKSNEAVYVWCFPKEGDYSIKYIGLNNKSSNQSSHSSQSVNLMINQ